MGRSKGSQRTKGNTRPSSSGHSAELLNYSGKPLSGFVGFRLPSKDTANDIYTVRQTSNDEVDSSVNSMLRPLMKKMLKRDAVTKLKAMSEFNDFCAKEENEVLRNILPFWPRLFNKLALDCDRRVREATHKANRTLLVKVKRNFAPYLKNVMGTWLIGQCDSYAPSASAAQHAFTSAFPQQKQVEALLFCKNDVFTFFQENLFHKSTGSVEQTAYSKESDVDGPFDVIVIGTLRSMKLFLSLLSHKDQIKIIQDDVTTIVSNKKYWEYAQSKDPQVRAAWYDITSTLCHVMPEAFKSTTKKVISSVLNCLSEEDPTVAPAVWECALSCMDSFKDYWMFIDVRKVVLPQLWTLLKDGGKGNATVIYPCLLPLISKLPKDITEDGSCFYTKLFCCLKKSLYLERIKSSSSECNAVIRAFVESLHYAISCSSLLSKEIDFLRQICVDELVPLIESSFTMIGYHLPVSSLYPLLGQFLHFLESKASIEKAENKLGLYTESLTAFWSNMLPLFLKIMNWDHSETKNSDLSCLAYFFHCLNNPSDTLIKRKKIVRFHSECIDSNEHNVHHQSPCIKSLNDHEHVFMEESFLFQNTVKFWKILWLRYEQFLEPSCIKLMSEIISAACCVDLFLELLKTFDVQCEKKEEAPVIFYKTVILNWLKIVPCISALDSIIDIIFSICSCIDRSSALDILNVMCEVEYEKPFIRLAVRGLSQYKSDKIMCEWLRSAAFGNSLFNLIKSVTVLLAPSKEDQKLPISEAYCKSLHCFFIKDKDGETSVDEDCIKATLDLLSHSFPDPESWVNCKKNHYNIIDFVCETCECIFECSDYWNYPAFDGLMFKLFQFSLNCNGKNVTEKLLAKVSAVWRNSIFCIAIERKKVLDNKGFIHLASEELHSLLVNLKSCKNIENLVEHTLTFLSLMKDAFCAEHSESNSCLCHVVLSTLEGILPTKEEWKIMKSGLSLTILPFVLQGIIFSPLYSEPHIMECPDQIPEYIFTSKVISDLLLKTFLRIKFTKLVIEDIQSLLLLHLPRVLWSFAYASGNGYGKMENYQEYSCVSKLNENIFEMLELLTMENTFKLIHTLFDLSLSEGITWSIPLQKAVEIVKCLYPENTQMLFDFVSEANKSGSCHKYITAQAFLRSVSSKEKFVIIEELAGVILDPSEIFGNKSDSFGIMAELCCCIQEPDIIKKSTVLKKMIRVLQVVVDSQSLFAVNEKNYFQCVTQISAFLHTVIENSWASLDDRLWIMVIDLLVSWVKNCKKNENIITEVSSYVILMHQISSLLSLISSKLNCGSEEEIGIQLHSVVIPEWKQVFQNQISNDFLRLFFKVAGKFVELQKLPKAIEILLTKMCQATKYLTVQQILATFIPTFDENEIDENNGQWVENIHEMFVALAPFLTSSIRPLQYAVHSIIIRIMPYVPDLIIPRYGISNCDNLEEQISTKRFPLIETLHYTTNIVDSMLLGIKVDDCCTVEPYTDSYTYTLAYLLAWNEVIEFFTALSSENRSSYACYLEESKLLSALLYNLARLMPENPLSCGRKKDSTFESAFLEFPTLLPSDSPSSEELQHIACNVYFNVLKSAPALVRTWWNNLDKRAGEIVDRFTSKNVSGLLSHQEIQAVQDSHTQFENMTVKARPLSREVLASYTLDDLTVELLIQLPPNYPLGPIIVDSHGKIGVGQAQWRNWLLQLTTFLNYQNGSIIDALSLWKKNLDKKFEGIEECMICFYVIHSSSYKLPNFSCSTCKKKFHSSCLFKWFSASNNSTCPLCRNYF